MKVPTIRYYEQIGLLPEADRSDGQPAAVWARRARPSAFIRHARELGFSLEAIRDLLSLSDRPDQSAPLPTRLHGSSFRRCRRGSRV